MLEQEACPCSPRSDTLNRPHQSTLSPPRRSPPGQRNRRMLASRHFPMAGASGGSRCSTLVRGDRHRAGLAFPVAATAR